MYGLFMEGIGDTSKRRDFMEVGHKIGKIKKVPLRELWEKENKHFTEWLDQLYDDTRY